MATYHFQLLRGSTAKVNAYTGYEGELVFDKTKKSLFIHDGTTQGGIAVANVGHIPTKVSELVNDANYCSSADGSTAANAAVKDSLGNVLHTTYAPLASPALTGTPTAPNAAWSDSTAICNMHMLYDTGASSQLVHRSGNETIAGSKTFTETIQGVAVRAMWADVAEVYQSDEQYPAGTLVAFGGDKEITIATSEVNAIVSTNPALLINGKDDGLPIALSGRVPVRVIGKVSKFDKIVLSSVPGVAIVDNDATNPIGRALESSDDVEEKLVICATSIHL